MAQVIKKLNTKQIKKMSDYFKQLQSIELGIMSEDPRMSPIVKVFSRLPSLYSDPQQVEALLDEAKRTVKRLAAIGNNSGKMMSENTMEDFLQRSERQGKALEAVVTIDRANSIREMRRLELSYLEINKAGGILKADIEIYKKTAEIAGIPETEAIKRLVKRAIENEEGPAFAFQKEMKSIQVAALRRESSAAEMDEYRKYMEPTEQWQWISISVNPCPDCKIRAGVVMSWDEWQDMGIPGSGQTVCGPYCMCKLYPVGVADDLFGDVKEFKWDKNSGVLTTRSEEKIFENA